MATKILDMLKIRLYKAFDSAARYTVLEGETSGAAHIAMGTIAQAIVAIEREQREASEYRPKAVLQKDGLS